MKKLMMAMVLVPLLALADKETVDGIEWTYTVNDGKAILGRRIAGNLREGAVPLSTKDA